MLSSINFIFPFLLFAFSSQDSSSNKIFDEDFSADRSCFWYPLHANCAVEWTVDLSCSDVKTKLKDQMELWKDRTYCPDSGADGEGETLGEKCLYEFSTQNATAIKGYHFTPVENYRDTFYYYFKTLSDNKCKFVGHSASDLWYAHLDLGTNYCNIANLVHGSGLNEAKGYKERTNFCICTQYDKRNCEKY